MFKNYLMIALRNIRKHKGYSFINIAGLAIGMACCLLILLWVQHEISYNRFHKNADSIYRIYTDFHYDKGIFPFSNIPQPVGPEFQKTIPEIDLVVRLLNGESTVKHGDDIFYEKRILYVDPSFFAVFTFPFIQGDAQTSFSEPYSVLITESMAKKYFGNRDPIGEVLTLDQENQVIVTGVIKDAPDNSSIRFDFLIPYSYLDATGYDTKKWDAWNCQTYVLLNENVTAQQVVQKIQGYPKTFHPEEEAYFRLQCLKHIRLYTLSGAMGSIKYVYILSVIALFILVIACINFMNLATARSAKRAREVGLRKVVGARRAQIIRQFYGESLVMTILALGLALALAEALLPFFNRVSGKNLALDFSGNFGIYLAFTGIALFTAIISGSYPAIYLSSFLPAKVLKSSYRSLSGSSTSRKVLVVFQFSLSIMLIISTAIVYSQLKYIQNKDLGFDKENLIYVGMDDYRILRNFDAIKSEMLLNPSIMKVTRTFQIPSYNRFSSDAEWEGKNPSQKILFNISIVDPDYLDTMKLKLIEGRNFSWDLSTDTSNYILNEEAVNQMGIDSPVGKWLECGEKGEIVGIVKNYHYMPFTYEIQPLILNYNPSLFRYAMIRIRGMNIPQTIAFLEKLWNKFAPEYPFEYHFLNEDYVLIYQSERRMSEIFRYFTLLAIFISCLGLFGLASFMAEQRTKEIGVRKVLGATVSGIIVLLSKEFTKWVLAANVIAWPVAYYTMSKWLKGFAYSADISLLTFILAGVLALLIAVLTVGYQAIRAAVADPVHALRYE
ncbi:MAG: ABC transporter permease [Candidatus Aminicenantes bacterium]|nr:MAG: ABC transporter permease [Candidatus Aminicenantes bacterium]